MSIKEFSRLTGINSSTLRNWDKTGLFSPAKRDPENKYRYYTPQQIIAVNFITVLSKLNVPLKTISRFENIRNPENIVDLIEQQEKNLDMEMSRLRESYSIIHIRRDLIKLGMKADPTVISIEEMENRSIIIGKPNSFDQDEKFFELFVQFFIHARELRINRSYPIGGVHKNMYTFLKAPDKPDYFFSIDPTGNSVQKGGTYMVGYARGHYGQFGDLPARMASYAKKNDLTCVGPVYTLYIHDETCIRDPSRHLAQLFVAVSK